MSHLLDDRPTPTSLMFPPVVAGSSVKPKPPLVGCPGAGSNNALLVPAPACSKLALRPVRRMRLPALFSLKGLASGRKQHA